MAERDDGYEGADVVRRSIRVPSIPDRPSGRQIEERLRRLAGMLDVRVEDQRKRVRVTYDAAQLDFARIDQALEELGYPTSRRWWSRLKAAWYRDLDETARANAGITSGSCCSSPTDVYAQRRRG
jgi:copper chaperone CopZ